MAKVRTRTIEYNGYHIVQTVEWKENPMDGAGDEVRTTIKEIPKYSGFDKMVWLGKDKQKQKIEYAVEVAKYKIDSEIKDKKPDLFEELGFK